MTVLSEDVWSRRFADSLVERLRNSEPTAVTWLNHHSVQMSKSSGVNLSSFDFVGIDGILLRRILGTSNSPRTSADLVMPLLLSRISNASVAIVGGSEKASKAARDAIGAILTGGSRVVYERSGYGQLPTMSDMVAEAGPIDVLIVGLGAPKQDQYLCQIQQQENRPIVSLTCGGWLDQISVVDYYPSWAYRYRMNWLIRLYREPKRLWRRYTVDALRAWLRRKELSEWVGNSRGYKAHLKLASDD